MDNRGYLANVQGNLSNFYNPEDLILKAWDVNNRDIKPVGYGPFGPWYDYFPSEPPNWRRKLSFFGSAGRLINDPEESMPFIARSRTVAVGRQGATGGPININNGRNVNAPPFNFGDEHSAPWERGIQQLRAYYDELLVSFGITPNVE